MKQKLLDRLDQELIAQLRVDGRASVSKLSTLFGVSRATIQSRIDRLVESGDILGFTIRVKEELEQGQISAIMMLAISDKSTAQIVQRLKGIPNIIKIHTTNGAWDMVLHIVSSSLSEFDQVLQRVRLVEGVSTSETSILLSSQ